MKTKIYLFILIYLLVLFIFCFAYESVYAEGKKIDVSVNVISEENNQDNNYLDLNNFGSLGVLNNQVSEIKESSLNEEKINPKYLQEVGGLASSREINTMIFPFVLIIFMIILIVIYFLKERYKRKKRKKCRKRILKI